MNAPRPLRVLHLRNSDLFGGPERLLLDQALAAGPHVHPILASFGRGDVAHPLLDPASAAGVETLLIPQGNSYDPRMPWRFGRLLRELAPDVVIGHDYKADLVLSLAAGDIPRVAVVHGYTGEDAKIRFFEAVDRRLLKRVAAVIVVSDALRERLTAAGVRPERIHVVPNGVDADRIADTARADRDATREALGVAPGDVALLTLGRLSPEKGQDVLLDAVAKSDRLEGVRILLVGDGASRVGLEARASALGIEKRVRFAGWRDDPWACLGASDLLVLPSRTEGLPLALLEAMAAGTPVVATDVGAVKEALDDGRFGLVVTPEDPGALQLAIEAAVENTEATNERARLAAKRVRDVYSITTQARRLEAIYEATARAAP